MMSGGDLRQAMELAQEGLHFLPDSSGIMRDLASLLYGATMPLFQQDIAVSLRSMTETAYTSLRHGNYLIASFVLENRALKEVSQGRLHQAECTCQEALRIARTPQERQLSFVHWAHLHLGDIYREWNQLERARETLEHCMGQSFTTRHPEIVVDGYIALARVYASLDKRERALDVLDEMDRTLQFQVAPHTAWQMGACRARLHCQWGELNEAERWAKDYERDF